MSAAANKVSQPDSRYLTQPSDVLDCLKRLRDMQTPITLTIDGSNERITCRVLDTTEDAFLIEDVLPRSALKTLKSLPRFALSARAQGTYAFAEGLSVLEHLEERSLPYFRISLPEALLFQQKRKHARVALPLRVSSAGANVTVFLPDPLVGRIIDISAGGLRAEFTEGHTHELKIDRVFTDCAISLPPLLDIHSECVIRHARTDKDGRDKCGFELTRMHVTDRRRLERWIKSLSARTA